MLQRETSRLKYVLPVLGQMVSVPPENILVTPQIYHCLSRCPQGQICTSRVTGPIVVLRKQVYEGAVLLCVAITDQCFTVLGTLNTSCFKVRAF